MTRPRAKRVRWACPDCGSAKLAPAGCPKDDVRRFCLPCSEKSGRLVPRTTPALDRARAQVAAKRVKRAEREQAKRERGRARQADAAEGKWIYGPLDMRAELRRVFIECYEVRAVGGRVGTVDEILGHPDTNIRRGGKLHSSGRARNGTPERPGRIAVTLGTCPASAWAVLLHEALHAIGMKHGRAMRRVEAAAARARWGVDAKVSSDTYGTIQEVALLVRSVLWSGDGLMDQEEKVEAVIDRLLVEEKARR